MMCYVVSWRWMKLLDGLQTVESGRSFASVIAIRIYLKVISADMSKNWDEKNGNETQSAVRRTGNAD